ncbi:[Fe-Fe] hydrogenase large subunit C-terminal domain-containing protein [Chitinivibrio alkaliphilus]|uniref:Fe-only hydrogenase, hydrogen sensor subunit HfsB n=1 Tax=Chitinivibrio alkaliphilus ACht1 TaxID=1313304 RepID=U7D6C5_9BACT|nr:[Fe-Fe] hydrogenase large subunit C-terminal domain-containing protein [Chitinivibrio alkaliphilus]ERP32069.1 Fe-only hydrogenase, hydrogen sensor subunit HfsB [Chitinivibrio alkaliphilus ACht1]
MHAPIYTEQRACQDCYKCVRQCPVKAIEVVNSSAVVNHTYCIFCGKCTLVCPAGAKKIRCDISRARNLLDTAETTILSLAPSYGAEFSDRSPEELIAEIQSLGFFGVSETALGAEIISDYLQHHPHDFTISTACPPVVELITTYLPHLLSHVSQAMSPLMAHACMLKEQYGPETKVIFAGPCPAKKLEADREDTAIDLALTFSELRELLRTQGESQKKHGGTFIPYGAHNGTRFPLDGGMSEVMKERGDTRQTLSYSGIDHIVETLKKTSAETMPPVFLELLSCAGGCINGAGCTTTNTTILRELSIIPGRKHPSVPALLHQSPHYSYGTNLPLTSPFFYPHEITTVLRDIGKYSAEDEINCAGCGYNSCRDFARACLLGKAETTMCVVHMRRQAEEKNDALLRTIPLGVVLVDSALRIVECNAKFMSLFSDIEFSLSHKELQQLRGKPLHQLIPCDALFSHLFEKKKKTHEIRQTIHNKIYRIFLFQINDHRQAGAIFQDITSPAVKAEEVIGKTEEVIQKNLSTVQTIASLLGENAAETQLMLNSIIETFRPSQEGESRGGASFY